MKLQSKYQGDHTTTMKQVQNLAFHTWPSTRVDTHFLASSILPILNDIEMLINITMMKKSRQFKATSPEEGLAH